MRGATVFNIISSNVINFIQYLATIILNKNGYRLKNNAIKTDIILVLFTIIIPILLLSFSIEVNPSIVPLFIILYIFFKYLNHNAHKLYLRKSEIKKEEIKQSRIRIHDNKTIRYLFILALTGIALYLIGQLLGNTLDNLCNDLGISEIILGFLLGFITSIPELITFFESQKHHNKKENEMLGVVEATNNLLTSNSLNLFVIQSIGIIIINFLKKLALYY